MDQVLDNKSATLATARRLLGGAGTQTAGLAFGGQTPTATEEFTGAFLSTKTLTTS
jgi:hypothetical protein